MPEARRIKLAVYLPSLESGGAERLHVNLAPQFMEAGLDVTFVLQQRKGALLPLLPQGVRIISLDRPRTLASLLPLMRFLQHEKPDVLLSNLGHNNIIALWAAALAGVPTRVIASYHSVFSAETSRNAPLQYRILPWLSRQFLARADGVVAVSKGAADDLAAVTGLARDRISVIYNPVVRDFEKRMNEPASHPWLAPGSPPFILGVGRLVPSKDFAALMTAFANVAQKKDLRLMLLGEGPLRNELLALAESLGARERVSLPGFVVNPLPYMQKAAMLVMSSRYEGFGNVLAEALACGTNVVSTDCPFGPAEILENGRFGRLTPVDDAEALAKAILATLEHPLPSHILQVRGRAFTTERIAEQYIGLFHRALGHQDDSAATRKVA